MITFLIFAVFFILLLIPFMPGIIELIKRRDAAPLFIDKNYTKDPRFFGKSFKLLMENAIGHDDLKPGFRTVKLSKDETIEIAPCKKIYAGEESNHVSYITGDFISTGKARFNKEIYVKGDTAIGSENMFRAVACMGNVFISEKSNIIRWVDADGNIDVCRECNLGISISCGGQLKISKHCRFKRLYGLPIITTYDIPLIIYNLHKITEKAEDYDKKPGGDEETGGTAEPAWDTNDKDLDRSKQIDEITDTAWVITEKNSVIPPFTRIAKDFIIKKNLRVKRNCVFMGDIKTYGDLIIEKDVKIFGNVFSEKNIEIGHDTVISGDVFSQGTVNIRERVKIGNSGKIKSVIGKKGIMLGRDVKIYGYVMTEGSGKIV